MKKIYKLVLMIAGVVGINGLQSCSLDNPFESAGEGNLMLVADIRSDIQTRSEDPNENQELRDKCVVYIESVKGVIRKYIGLDQLPTTPITLNSGHYVAEAWTGDSVPASFTSKFYRGKEEFEISAGDNKSLLLHCNIANVITSVNPDVLELGLTNVNITFSHSRDGLTFTEEKIAAAEKGYFMMPSTDTDLTYKVTGEKSDGTLVERTGVIEGVKRAYEYVLNIIADEQENNLGGGLIRIQIEEIPVFEDTVEIYGRPSITGVDFDIDSQIVGEQSAEPGSVKAFTDKIVYIRAFEGIYKVKLTGNENFAGHVVADLDLLDGSTNRAELEDKGIFIDGPSYNVDATSEVKVQELRITFKKQFFDELAPLDTEYRLDIDVLDDQKPQGKDNTKTLRIATTENALEFIAPVETADVPDPVSEPMAILAHSATLYGIVKDEAATEYGIRYRKEGDQDWITVPATTTYATRAGNKRFSVKLDNLDEATTYEYKAYEASYDSAAVLKFTTEAHFPIPNASFEKWSKYSAKTLFGTSDVVIPWEVGDKDASFWGTGNEGSATVGATLTNSSEVMKKSGTYSARLESKTVMSIPAAGNVFVGKYVDTDGTNGILALGREYNGSHPTKLKVWANYRPGTKVVKSNSTDTSRLPDNFVGGTDHGQIYVALTTEPVEIRTNPSKLKVFDQEDPVVLAYGEQTWTGDFGPEGELAAIEIPLTYYDRAYTTPATHLIIVVSASKYGDFFAGSDGSLMYLDDFELVYEK